jgi:hypothetical protein
MLRSANLEVERKGGYRLVLPDGGDTEGTPLHLLHTLDRLRLTYLKNECRSATHRGSKRSRR